MTYRLARWLERLAWKVHHDGLALGVDLARIADVFYRLASSPEPRRTVWIKPPKSFPMKEGRA